MGIKRIASHKTISRCRKTRRSYAYNALERDSMLDLENSVEIDDVFNRFLKNQTTREEDLAWAYRQREFLELRF